MVLFRPEKLFDLPMGTRLLRYVLRAFTKAAKPPPSGRRCRCIKWAEFLRPTFENPVTG
jgi:hypothetical protein